ncbi:MAG: hypothetical protein AB7T06_16990 [Kofleriaceae bacterium]
MRTPRALVLLGICSMSCGGNPAPAPQGPADPGPSEPPIAGPAQPLPTVDSGLAKKMTEKPAKPDRAPELFPPPYKKVGVGQLISFATTAIDQDLDETRTELTKKPASATWDAITQTVSWKPTKADIGKQEFVVTVTQPTKNITKTETWTIEVTAKPQPLPVAEQKSALIETVLMIRQPKRLEQVNKDWPLDKMLLVSAQGFAPQFAPEKRAAIANQTWDKNVLFEGFLSQFATTQNNDRLDPGAPDFDKDAFGDPAAWKIVAFRPRIDRHWTELRVVYQAVKAPEPVFAMFRIRPVVEFVPALPRPAEEKALNNKVFLGLVAKHLMPGGAPSEKFLKDQAAHGKAVAAFMNEFMSYNDEKTAPYARTFSIGIALEARMGGGSTRNADGSYKSGDGWAWSAQKPFITPKGDSQNYQNVIIPGFWTKTIPSEDGKSWVPTCGPRWTPGPAMAPGHQILCRKTLGFVDLPDWGGRGGVRGGRIDANNLYVKHKNEFMQVDFPLEDGRRDVGEENGMTCSQCHIRNFGMHDYSDPANTDPSKGVPKTLNKKIATLNFQIIPTTHWEEFTLEFLKHQECRAKEQYAKFAPDVKVKLGCPFTDGVK